MTLPTTPPRYDPEIEAQRSRTLEDADRENVKRKQDLELVNQRLILRSPNGNRWKITVSNAGVVGATAL